MAYPLTFRPNALVKLTTFEGPSFEDIPAQILKPLFATSSNTVDELLEAGSIMLRVVLLYDEEVIGYFPDELHKDFIEIQGSARFRKYEIVDTLEWPAEGGVPRYVFCVCSGSVPAP